MKFKLFTAIAILMSLFCGCSNSHKTSEQKDKTLILYYSQTGTTKAVAEEFQRLLDADIAVIEAVEPYAEDYAATVERWRQEKENGTIVPIKPLDINLDDYTTIFIGFPVWGGTYASPVSTFLSENSLSGKKIVTFATFGSGGIESATSDMQKAQPQAEILKGYGVRNARIAKAPEEIRRFLVENGFIEGEITAVPDYSESLPVTEEDVEIFNLACSNYQFPLGTPVEVARRSYDGTSDYKFTVTSKTPDGEERTALIYVTVAPDSAPEFTQVVR